MSLHEYAALWNQHKAGLDARLLYLKDWHFVNEFPEYQARTIRHLKYQRHAQLHLNAEAVYSSAAVSREASTV